MVGEHYPIFHDAERVIADPIVRNRGTDRRLAVPGRPGRGPVRRVRRAAAPRGDLRSAAGRAPCRAPSSTTARTRRSSRPARCSPRCACRSARAAAARTRRWSAAPATGRSPRPAPRSGLDGGGDVERRRDRPGRRRRRALPRRRGRGRSSSAGPPPRRTSPRPARIAARAQQPERRPARPGRLQAAPRRRADRARAARRGRRARAQSERGGLTMQITITVNGESTPATSSRGCCWSTSCATTWASPEPTGAATRPTAASASCWLDGVTGQVLHGAGRDGRRPARSAPSRAWSTAAGWTRSSRASCEATACSAASAPRA